MKILVASCDKNNDLFFPFHYCMEKYWPNHPEIIYSTETVLNPYYKTICKNYDLSRWTDRIYDTCLEIDDEFIILMVDDIFLRFPVDDSKLRSLTSLFDENTAACNLQYTFDNKDIPINDLVNSRPKNGEYKTSVMCQLFKKEKLLDLFNLHLDPWKFELLNDGKNYDFLILKDHSIINWWGKNGVPKNGSWGVRHGKWGKDCIEFLKQEGLQIDFDKRGRL